MKLKLEEEFGQHVSFLSRGVQLMSGASVWQEAQRFFRLNRTARAGLFLDSGSYLIVLVQTASTAVRNEIFRFFRDNFQLLPQARQQEFDLCYNVPIGNYTFPTMTFHFDRANLFLDAGNIFEIFDQGFCLMMMPTTMKELAGKMLKKY